MIAADTNVWARAYLNDDVAQAMKARSVIEAECQHSGVFVPLIVLAELFWVLRSRWKKERVLQTLGHLLETDGVIVEAPTVVAKALKEARAQAKNRCGGFRRSSDCPCGSCERSQRGDHL
jgi:predicted nucleic-acid-binding protein